MDFSYVENLNLKNYMPSNSQLNNLSSFFYAFSDNTRLSIIILLMIKPLCVGDITSILNINQTTVSHQLKILKSLNIVSGDRNGKNIIYYVKNSNLENIFNIAVDCV